MVASSVLAVRHVHPVGVLAHLGLLVDGVELGGKMLK